MELPKRNFISNNESIDLNSKFKQKINMILNQMDYGILVILVGITG